MSDAPKTEPLACLTPCERKVMMEALRTGESAKGLSARLGITRRTVEKHRQEAQHKLGVKSIFQLGALALQLGFYKLELTPAPIKSAAKLCRKCGLHPQIKSSRSNWCADCDNALRRQKYKLKVEKTRRGPPKHSTCNCPDPACTGVHCTYMRPVA